MAPFHRRADIVRTATAVAGAVLVVTILAACAPEPEASSSPTPTTSTPRPSSASPTPSPSATEAAGAALVLPAACQDIYSDAMFAEMTATAPPLNDPGLTILSTEMAAGLEVLDTAPTLRCTWGAPSEFGLSTNVTIVDTEQNAALEQSMRETGMTCTAFEEGTLCRIETEHLMDDDTVSKIGETHFLRGDGWVSTHWINLAPEGYTEDIVATLWG